MVAQHQTIEKRTEYLGCLSRIEFGVDIALLLRLPNGFDHAIFD